jgi:hypothetical protein
VKKEEFMRQRKTFLFITSILSLLTIMAALPEAAIASEARKTQLSNQSEACKSKKEYGCAKICLVAAKNPDNKALGEKCDRFYRDALQASKPSVTQQPKELGQVLRDQARFCQTRKDRPCAQACSAATKNAADAAAVQQCNAEYKRVYAANPPPKPKPEESMTLAQRIALMKDKLAYCQAKKTVNTERGMRRPLDGCIGACGDKRVSDLNYPESQREAFVGMCEGLYYPIFQKFGK